MRRISAERAHEYAEPRTQCGTQQRRRHHLRGLACAGVRHAPIELNDDMLMLSQRSSHSRRVHERGVQLAASGGHKRVAALANWMLDAALRLALSHDTEGTRHKRRVGQCASDEALLDFNNLCLAARGVNCRERVVTCL